MPNSLVQHLHTPKSMHLGNLFLIDDTEDADATNQPR